MEENRTRLNRWLCLPIMFYQLLIKPILPPCCRFYPSCSEYAKECFIKHGLWKGTGYIFFRLLRCHPWHEGGCDPVP